MSDVSVGHSDEQVGCKGNCYSLGEWRHLVRYQVAQSRRTRGHFDLTIGLVPTRSDVSASPSITVSRMCSRLDGCKCRNLSSLLPGCVPAWMRVFHHYEQDVVPTWVEEQRSSTIVLGFRSSLDESAEIFHHCEQDVVSAWVEEHRSSIIVVGCGSGLDGRT